jgi:hypothetical protein
VRARSLVDLTLSGHKARVRQELRLVGLTAPAAAGGLRLRLRMPASVSPHLKVLQGNQPLEPGTAEPAGKEVRRVVELRPGAGPEVVLVLEYGGPLEALQGADGERAAGVLGVPLVIPESATQGETRVRVWSDPGWLPKLVGPADWSEQSIEEVAGQRRLPVLVAQAQGSIYPCTCG